VLSFSYKLSLIQKIKTKHFSEKGPFKKRYVPKCFINLKKF
jgi:hypothetical protein